MTWENVLKAKKKTPKLKRVKGGVMYRGEKFPGVNKPKRAPKGSTTVKRKRIS
jgi:hypothetical protein